MSLLEQLQHYLERHGMHVVTCLNLTYGLVELTSYRCNPSLMLKPPARKATIVIGGIVATSYLLNIGYRMGGAARDGGWKETWDNKSKIEKVCTTDHHHVGLPPNNCGKQRYHTKTVGL
jgi:hypothetical protein